MRKYYEQRMPPIIIDATSEYFDANSEKFDAIGRSGEPSKALSCLQMH